MFIVEDLVILPVNDGLAKHRIEVLQTNSLTAAEAEVVLACTLPDDLWLGNDMLIGNIDLSPVEETMPAVVTQRQIKFNLDFYTQLLKGHVCRTLDKCLATVGTVFK